MRSLLLWLAFWFVAGSSLIQAQRTLHVPADYSTVQAAVDAAKDGNTVLVAPGTYRENIDVLNKSITITSGATDASEATETILEGQTSAPTVLFWSNIVLEYPAVALNGFTVTHAPGIATDANNTGNGVAVSDVAATVSHNQVLENPGCGIVTVDVLSITANDNTITSSSSGTCGQVPALVALSYPYQNDPPIPGEVFFGESAPLTVGGGGYVTLTGNRIVNKSIACAGRV